MGSTIVYSLIPAIIVAIHIAHSAPPTMMYSRLPCAPTLAMQVSLLLLPSVDDFEEQLLSQLAADLFANVMSYTNVCLYTIM